MVKNRCHDWTAHETGLKDTMRMSASRRQTQVGRRKRQRRGLLTAGIFVVTALSQSPSSPHTATAFVHTRTAPPPQAATCRRSPAFTTPYNHARFTSRERTWVESRDRASCVVGVRMAAAAAGRERAGGETSKNKPPSLPQVCMNQGNVCCSNCRYHEVIW